MLKDGVRSKYLLGNGDAPWYGGAGVLASDFIKANPAAAKAYIAGLRRGFDEVRKNINESRAVYPTYTSFTVALSEAIRRSSTPSTTSSARRRSGIFRRTTTCSTIKRS